jgi:hypothetical protein
VITLIKTGVLLLLFIFPNCIPQYSLHDASLNEVYWAEYSIATMSFFWKENDSEVIFNGRYLFTDGNITINNNGTHFVAHYYLWQRATSELVMDKLFTFELSDDDELYYLNGTYFGRTLLKIEQNTFIEGTDYILGDLKNNPYTLRFSNQGKQYLKVNGTTYYIDIFDFSGQELGIFQSRYIKDCGLMYYSLGYIDPMLDDYFQQYYFNGADIFLKKTSIKLDYKILEEPSLWSQVLPIIVIIAIPLSIWIVLGKILARLKKQTKQKKGRIRREIR